MQSHDSLVTTYIPWVHYTMNLPLCSTPNFFRRTKKNRQTNVNKNKTENLSLAASSRWKKTWSWKSNQLQFLCNFLFHTYVPSVLSNFDESFDTYFISWNPVSGSNVRISISDPDLYLSIPIQMYELFVCITKSATIIHTSSLISWIKQD